MTTPNTTNTMVREFKAIREATNIDWAAYLAYSARVLSDRDIRTPFMCYPEWIAAGRPGGPFTNG